MKILGFRSDPQAPRFALIDSATTPLSLINAASESRLCLPPSCKSDDAQVAWLYREFERIFSEHKDIVRVVIKKGEFTQGDNGAKRTASYQEAALLLYCGLNGKPVVSKLYASLGTNSGSVVAHAAQRVGQTTKYWNNKMADAVVAAYWGATHP